MLRPVTPFAIQVHGSTLFGTTRPDSDLDLVAIHLPSAAGILLGCPEDALRRDSKLTPSGAEQHRLPPTGIGETDATSLSLGRYFALLRAGDAIALEMLWTPEAALRQTTPLWDEVRAARVRFTTRNLGRMIGYARSQSEMYGRKAERFKEIQRAEDVLTGLVGAHGADATLADVSPDLGILVTDSPYLAVVPIDSGYTPGLLHLSIAGKAIPFTAKISRALQTTQAHLRQIGSRTRAAAEGVDWKSLSHAMRITREAKELVASGTITFPRPEAEELLAIRNGQRSVEAVIDELDVLAAQVIAQAPHADLPDEPDHALMDEFQIRAYHAHISTGTL